MNYKKILRVIFAVVSGMKLMFRILGIALLVFGTVLFLAFSLWFSYALMGSIWGVAIFFVALIFGGIVLGLSASYARDLGQRTRQASSEELQREDDVLLQAVAFSQSVFFIYLNTIQNSNYVAASRILVLFFAISFFALRAWGKVADNGKYRYWSIWLFFLILLLTFGYIASALIGYLVGGEGSKVGYFVGSFYGGIILGSMQIIAERFKKRYGLAGAK